MENIIKKIISYWESQGESIRCAVKFGLSKNTDAIVTRETKLRQLKSLSLSKDTILQDGEAVIALENDGFMQSDFDVDKKVIKAETLLKSRDEEIERLKTLDNKVDTIDNKVDIIILDVTLPDGNGFDLYKNYIKNMGIPVIFLTARDSEEDIVNALDMGASDYLTKPFRTGELIARINKILNKFFHFNPLFCVV